jgi:hypothetical protein
MRKNRATSSDSKKRKSRKFVASTAETFSIGDDTFEGEKSASSKLLANMYDDSKFLVDEKPELPASVVTTRKDSADLSDMDLILQLAQAEDDDYSAMSAALETSTPASTDSSTMASSSPSKNTSLGAADNFLDSLTEDTSPVESSNANANVSTTATSTSAATDELLALEDFERELGLMGAPATSDSTKEPSGEAGAAAPESDTFDDNLDELEKYLQSLGDN